MEPLRWGRGWQLRKRHFTQNELPRVLAKLPLLPAWFTIGFNDNVSSCIMSFIRRSLDKKKSWKAHRVKAKGALWRKLHRDHNKPLSSSFAVNQACCVCFAIDQHWKLSQWKARDYAKLTRIHNGYDVTFRTELLQSINFLRRPKIKQIGMLCWLCTLHNIHYYQQTFNEYLSWKSLSC